MKYTKWLLAAAVISTAPVFTSCDNDDDVVVAPLPDKFSTVLSSLSIDWNETEGVVDFEAPGKWKAESACEWIEVDPTNGAAGEHRLWLSVTPNPYMLPRTGEIHITCGDDYGKIVVTQAGAPAENVAPVDLYLEVPSLDWQTGEINLSAYSNEIMGNLGMTLEEFNAGVGDEGNLDFFVVDKNGQWVAGGTSGTRCGAWFNNDMEVTQWSTGSYPANAAFMEIYNDEEPVIVIGRAPANPDNADYTVTFGFTLANDHSRYQLFKLNFVFTAVDLKGTVVATHDLVAEIAANDGYEATQIEFDAAAICAELGCASLDLAKVVGYDSEGEFAGYTANNGYWYMTNGSIGSWGEGAGWFIEYWGEGVGSDNYSSFAIGPFPGVTDVAATSKIGFWYNNNVVMFNLHVQIGEGGSTGGDDPQTVDVVSFLELSINVPANNNYETVTLTFDASAVETALGVPASECKIVALEDDGSLIATTANNGYWYSMDGTVCGWGEGALCFIEYHGDEDESLASSFNVGPFPEAKGTAVVQIGFMHDNKVVLYDVNVTVE